MADVALAARLFARLLPRRPALAPRGSRLLGGPLPLRRRALARELAEQLACLEERPGLFARQPSERRGGRQVITRHTAASLARAALGIARIWGGPALVAALQQLAREGDRAEMVAVEEQVQVGAERRRAEDERVTVEPSKAARAYEAATKKAA